MKEIDGGKMVHQDIVIIFQGIKCEDLNKNRHVRGNLNVLGEMKQVGLAKLDDSFKTGYERKRDSKMIPKSSI